MTEPLPEERKQTLPDTWSLAWWEKRFQEVVTAYRGASHSINVAVAVTNDVLLREAELKLRCETLERQQFEDRAKIGELQAWCDSLERERVKMQNLAARVERMAAHLNSQRKIGSTETTL